MDKAELLSEFKAQLALFDKYRTFIDKARSYAERFNPAVVEKVIADNTEKIGEVSATLNPLVNDMRGLIAGLRLQREGVRKGVQDARLQVEELKLRLMITEISQGEYDELAAGFERTISDADDEEASLELDIGELSDVLERWLANRPDAGDTLDDDSADDEDDVADDEMEAGGAGEEESDDLLGDLEDDEGVELEADEEEDMLAFEDAEDPGHTGVHSERPNVVDDVSAVFEEREEENVEEPVLEGGDAGGIDFAPGEIDDLGADLFSEPAPGGTAAGEPEGRAVLIMGEGTAEEHVYPLTGEVMSLGRGRDNTVQVKNDSKVSRYHCKVFKREGHFFISDNKSANGTLVDGELITDKRLVGGEEVIVGETFFRFRIER
jgi:hypothetical protein